MERLTEKETSVYGGIEYVLCKHTDEECNDWCMYKKCEWIENALKKLKAYEDAEEQGLLLRLPCKVGDKVYKLWYANNMPYKVQAVTLRTLSNIVAMMEYDFFGKRVFLTKEEAEQALAKMKEGV